MCYHSMDMGAMAMKRFRVHQNSSITEASPSDCLESYQDIR